MRRAKKKRASAAKRAPGREHPRDPRLPAVGSVLTREVGSKTVTATVVKDGFAYEGKTYRSLSAVAKEATGTVWNGYLFFGLTKPATAKATPKRKEKAS